MDIENQAKKIAALVAEVDADDRGNLFVLIGNQLRLEGQGLTGTLIRSIGFEYGVNPKKPGYPGYKSP